MTTVDVSGWAKRNLWRTNSNAVAVRAGFRQLKAPDSGRKYVGGFSVKNDRAEETWHYVFDVKTTGAKDLRLHVMDGAFNVFQTMNLGADVDPRAITHAQVFNHLVIASPDIPTLWGQIGVGMTYADSVASDSGSDVVEIPRGICSSWNNRIVICDGRIMYVSDPVALGGGDVRSFIGENANQRPGIIYGVHEGAHGMIVVVTSSGVFGLDSAAAAVGVVGSNGSNWRILSHNPATSHASSCVVRGRVFGMTQNGFALIDTENDSEQNLSELDVSRAYGPRIFDPDWRDVRMFAGDYGPLVGHSDQSAIFAFDVMTGFGSWWTSDYAPILRGTLRDTDGDQLLLCENGVYRLTGDFDGDILLSSGLSVQPKGGFVGALQAIPSKNRDVKDVFAAAATGGAGEIAIALRGSAHATTPIVDPEGFVIGTDSWTTDKRATSTPMADVRIKFGSEDAQPTREPSLEIMVDGCLTRIVDVLDVIDASGAETRPSKVG